MTDDKSLTVIKPAMDLIDYKEDKKTMMDLVKSQMRENIDFGIVPYTKSKSLFKPGAEKLAKYYGLVPEYEMIKEIEDFEKGFLYYKYKCRLIHFKSGKLVGESDRSSNSKEKSYAGKQLYDLVNPVQAKAQKRAFVAAVHAATLASEIFVDEEEPTTDGQKVTKAQDPARVRLLGRMFQSAQDRGFTQEQVKSTLKHQYKVSSTTECTNQQLIAFTEKLLDTYRIVAVGQKPQKFTQAAISPKSEESEEKENDHTIDGEIIEERKEWKCYVCLQPVEPETYFCSEAHKTDYFGKKKPTPAERGWKFSNAKKDSSLDL